MTRFVAFLRGVNVGGVNLKMPEVAAAFEDAGFTAVKTVLASGNVLLDGEADVTAVSPHRRTSAARTVRLRRLGAGVRRRHRGEGVVYWQVPRSGTLATTIGKTMGKKRYKSSTTTRNLRTLDKVLRSVHSAR